MFFRSLLAGSRSCLILILFCVVLPQGSLAQALETFDYLVRYKQEKLERKHIPSLGKRATVKGHIRTLERRLKLKRQEHLKFSDIYLLTPSKKHNPKSKRTKRFLKYTQSFVLNGKGQSRAVDDEYFSAQWS